MDAVGVDIGGTKIAVGVVDVDGRILEKVRRPTQPEDPASIDAAIADAVRELSTRFDVKAVGVAAAGFVSADQNHVTFAPNIAWRDYPLGDKVAELIDDDSTYVVVDNDANAAGWAEYVHGAARGTRNMVLLTIGTGLGAAVVVNGEMVRGAYGFAAELGHVRVVPDGELCGCGQHGCWEQYASGSALTREARLAAALDAERGATLIALAGGAPELIKGPHVTQAAKEGDELAIELLADLGRWIGTGCAQISAVLDPEIFVIGGGVIDAGDLILEPARAAFAQHLTARAHRPVPAIVAADMGNDAGIVGAAALAREAVPLDL